MIPNVELFRNGIRYSSNTIGGCGNVEIVVDIKIEYGIIYKNVAIGVVFIGDGYIG